MAALSISQNVARKPILWWRFRQAAPKSDRTDGTEQPVRSSERVEDIAVVVEHGEGIGMLDRSGPAVG
jgi:hypothetical protein